MSEPQPEFKIAIVCSSNQNRSMEAHSFLGKKGFRVQSFGTGNQVKLPGPSPDKPNIYDFNVTYDEMYKDLMRKDPDLLRTAALVYYNLNQVGRVLHAGLAATVNDLGLSLYPHLDLFSYTQNGILHMLDRNRRIKPRPERFQASKEKFDIVITCEERVYDQVIEDIESREKSMDHVMHLINIDIQDNHEEATIGAFMICELVTMLYASDDLDNEVDEILQDFEHKINRPILHTALFY